MNQDQIRIDPEDQHLLEDHTWHVHKCGKQRYVRRTVKKNGKSLGVYLHRVIAGTQALDGEGLRPGLVDHRNNDSLDNRRENLRLTDKKGNNANRPGQGEFKGVVCVKGRYVAVIRSGGFDTPEEAAKEYNRLALVAFGPDAYQNEC